MSRHPLRHPKHPLGAVVTGWGYAGDHLYSLSRRISSKSRRAQTKPPPVHRLPPEIIARIFEILSDIYPMLLYRHDTMAHQIFYINWLVVTRVCSYWRQVALDHAILWRKLDPGILTRTRLCQFWLERTQAKSDDKYHNAASSGLRTSRGSVLLDVCTDEFASEACMLLLMHDFHRIRTLQLHFQAETTSASRLIAITQLLQGRTPTPQLQDIDLTKRDGRGLPTYSLPWNIIFRLLSHASALHTLIMRGTWFSWAIKSLTLLNGLRELTVESCQHVDVTASFSHVVDCLRGTPTLEKLVLRNALPLEGSESTCPYLPIHLPRLQMLRLRSDGMQSIRLWSLIESHPDIAIIVEIGVPFNEREVIHIATPALARFREPHPLSLHLLGNNYLFAFCLTPVAIGTMDVFDATSTTAPCSSSSLRLSFQTGHRVPADNALWSGLMAGLPMQRITNLVVPRDTNQDEAEVDLLPLFMMRRMTSLKCISAKGLRPTGLKRLARALNRIEDGISSGAHFHAPALQKIRLHHCNFDEASATLFLEALDQRADAGTRLSEMELKYTMFGRDTVQRFQSAVDIVRWDG